MDPARLNQAFIRQVHQGPTLNDILPKLNNVQYMSIIGRSSGYHNLKLDKHSSYLTTFSCPFRRYQYKQLPFGAVPPGNMFQWKIDEIFNGMPNVFGIADDILVIGYNKDGADHDEAFYNVLRQCQDVNLKLNKDKCHFRWTSIPFFGKVVSRDGIQPDLQKVKALTKMPAPKNKKELQAFLGIINYQGKFSPGAAEVCELLCKLTSCKSTWMWNASYQQLFASAKLIIKADVCMKFYDKSKLLYLETDASGIGLGAALLQLHDNMVCQKGVVPQNIALHPNAFTSKSLTGVEQRYSNIEQEVLGILHGLEKFHHYCFGQEVLIITDHKPFVAMFKKDVATLSQPIQCIMLKIHQYRVQILYKPGPKIFIEDWLLWHNHVEGKDKPIKDMDIWVDAIQSLVDMPDCISMEEIQQASLQDAHLQQLNTFIIAGWPHTKDELQTIIRPYWPYRDELAVIDGVLLKGRCIIILDSLKQQVLTQLHINHMSFENMKLLACKSVFWHNINADVEAYIKLCATCLEFQQTQPKEKVTHHNIPLRPWEVIGADIFHFKNKNYLCIVDYNSEFLVVKRLEGLSADNLINVVKPIFAKYGMPRKLMSDVGTNFVSDKFHQICKLVNIEQATSSAYHHQSNSQVKACIKFIKHTFKKCTDSGSDINMVLLQIQMTPLGHSLPSQATLMFNRPVCGIMPVIDCKPFVEDCDDDRHAKIIKRQKRIKMILQ